MVRVLVSQDHHFYSLYWHRVGFSDCRRGRKPNLGLTRLSIGMDSVSRREIEPRKEPELS